MAGSSSVVDPFLISGGRVSPASLTALCDTGKILESKQRTAAAKVISISRVNVPDLIIKVWYPDGWFSSARYNPYNKRFHNNAIELRRRGFPAPLIRGWGTIGIGATCFLCYEALPGKSLRACKPDVPLASAAEFIALLHNRGVDFRSLHMGNILQVDVDRYGLIDLTDCCFYRRPLAAKLRLRRLAYFCSHKRDADFMLQDGHWREFMEAYYQTADRDSAPPLSFQNNLNSFRKMLPEHELT